MAETRYTKDHEYIRIEGDTVERGDRAVSLRQRFDLHLCHGPRCSAPIDRTVRR